jgi:transcriptional regulator with XRE-family HTH domain
MSIGKEIKRIRIKMGISQKTLAGDVFNRSYISQIECGTIYPSAKAIICIAKKLNIPPISFIDSNTIGKIMTKDEVFDLFISARSAYLKEDYKKCISVLPLVVIAEKLLSLTDLISAQVWLVDSHYMLNENEKALELIDNYSHYESEYTRAELAISIGLNHIKGIIKYDTGDYFESLSCFLSIEETIDKYHLDVEKTLLLDILSRIQMIYESLGDDEKVEIYYHRILKLSQQFHLISSGTLRSINRYYRDHSKDSIEEMLAYYEFLIKMARLTGDTYRISTIYSSISELYLKYDCLSELEASLDMKEKAIMDISSPAARGYSMAFHHLFKGRYYVKLKEFDKALKCYTQSQELINNSKFSKSIKLEIDSLFNYSELYYHKGEYESAKMYLKMAENISEKNHTTVRNMNIYHLKALIYEKTQIAKL